MKPTNYFWQGLGLAAGVIAFDQVTKWWIVERVMQPPRTIPVTSYFNLVMGWNRGVSFGLFNTDSAINIWFLPLVAIVIVIGLVVWLSRTDRFLVAVAIALVIGGAVGNLIDRLRFGAVADFLDLHVAGYHWPAFNVADSGITVGAVVLVLESLFGPPEKPNNGAGEGIDST
jgi:signal peptidase II